MEFKAVNVNFDPEGNPIVTPEEFENKEGAVEQPEQPEAEVPEVGDSSEQEEAVEQEQPEQPEAEVPEVEEQEAEVPEVEEQEAGEQEGREIVELPDHVTAYLDFYKETGGSFEDFQNLNRDFKEVPAEQVIKEYLKVLNPGFDEEDINFILADEYSYDEELDTDDEIRRKKIAQKKVYNEGLKYLEGQKEKYKEGLVSRTSSPEAEEALEFYRSYKEESEGNAQKAAALRESFVKGTEQLFGENFEGFEVTVGDYVYNYKPADVKKTKEQNLDINNLIGKYTDKEGNVKDVTGWHKAMTAAMDPEGFAEFFFELGRTAAIEEDDKDAKNINTVRATKPSSTGKNQPKFKMVDLTPNQFENAKIKLKNY